MRLKNVVDKILTKLLKVMDFRWDSNGGDQFYLTVSDCLFDWTLTKFFCIHRGKLRRMRFKKGNNGVPVLASPKLRLDGIWESKMENSNVFTASVNV